MNATQLYDLAVTTARANLTETNPIRLASLEVQAAEAGDVAAADFRQFQQMLGAARQQYQRLATQKLPSEAVVVAKPNPTPAIVLTKPEPTA